MSVCIFCHRRPDYPLPYVQKGDPGQGCMYGFAHEYPEDALERSPVQKPKGPDRSLCPACGLHPKNPRFLANGCQHEGLVLP